MAPVNPLGCADAGPQNPALARSGRRVRTIGREFPVAVAAFAGERFSVRMSLDRNTVGNFSQFRRQQLPQSRLSAEQSGQLVRIDPIILPLAALRPLH